MSNPFGNMIDEKLLNLHTAFIAKVVSVSSPDLCSVKPLNKIKAYGQKAKAQGVISKVPVLNHVRRYTLVKQTLTVEDTYTGGGSITPKRHPEPENEGHIRVEPIKAGDLVLCVCGDRDITAACKGQSATPPVGHHEIKDAVVVGLLGRWPHE